ncbi:MAG TPA: hypothetical protein VF791_14130 [Pyrinomonadaceae bacterium]
MKKLVQLLLFAVLVSTLALSAFAQTTPAAGTASTAATSQDDAEAKAALYKKFTDNIKTNPDVAYEAGKEYLSKYEAGAAADDPYVKYIKKWVASYEKVARRTQFFKQYEAKDYAGAFASAKTVLVDYPDDVDVVYALVNAGVANMGTNDTLNADAAMYAKKAIQLVQAGKNPEAKKPKDEVLGYLNYAAGAFLYKTQPTEAVNYFINAAQLEGFYKKNPQTYILLAGLYTSTEYSKLATDFKAQCATAEQVETQPCKDLSAKVNSVVDRIIDALARAIAYSNTASNPALYNQNRPGWMETLTNFYKFRNNNSDTGLKELIAGITSRPIPKPGEAVAPMTPQTPSSTTPSSSTAPTQPGSTMNTTTPANTKQGTTPAATTTTQPNGKAAGTQPTGKTTSTKPTPKRAHAPRGKRN